MWANPLHIVLFYSVEAKSVKPHHKPHRRIHTDTHRHTQHIHTHNDIVVIVDVLWGLYPTL